jgi:hypothetical protein
VIEAEEEIELIKGGANITVTNDNYPGIPWRRVFECKMLDRVFTSIEGIAARVL